MRLIDADALKETLDKIPARSIENGDGRAYVLIRLSTVFEIIKQMPSVQSEDWMERNEERILQAGMEGREIEFRIGGRLFAIREKAQ